MRSRKIAIAAALLIAGILPAACGQDQAQSVLAPASTTTQIHHTEVQPSTPTSPVGPRPVPPAATGTVLPRVPDGAPAPGPDGLPPLPPAGAPAPGPDGKPPATTGSAAPTRAR